LFSGHNGLAASEAVAGGFAATEDCSLGILTSGGDLRLENRLDD
jgi:hypothetical protein